ncbi:SdpI family protein [Nocardia jiangxiensis]|uniref:SdpI family protein n=1 Tax=Nocardia jiangxiensis TaxID=282685 RepID=A0ABW6RWX7_9NOCA|nr:SdpI family protein [Nocardia jiangxiensis]
MVRITSGGSSLVRIRYASTVVGVFVVALILFVLAAVAVVTGVLGLTGSLPPNRYFGVHTEEAVRTEQSYRLANKVAAPTSIGAGLLLIAGGVVALVAGPIAGIAAAVVAAVIALFTLGAGVNAAGQAIARLAPVAEVGSCGNACGACTLRDACQPAN